MTLVDRFVALQNCLKLPKAHVREASIEPAEITPTRIRRINDPAHKSLPQPLMAYVCAGSGRMVYGLSWRDVSRLKGEIVDLNGLGASSLLARLRMPPFRETSYQS